MLAAALDYAGRGWSVLPLEGKIPRNRNGLTSASTNVGQLGDWWRRWPDANVGIRTGAESGLVVLDVDPRHGGLLSLEKLKRQHGSLAPVPQVLTGSGGQHLYFAHPGVEVRNSAGKVGDGLDIRGDGGYVVAPPSIHESGNPYKWLRVDGLEAAPSWLLEASASTNGNTAANIPDVIPEGQRRAAMLTVAGKLKRAGLSGDEILPTLQKMNERCRPPLDEQELASVAYPSTIAAAAATAPAGIVWERLSDVAMRSIVFLDKPLLQADAFHLVAGRKGQGKGTNLADTAARVTRGELGSKRNVVWIGSEDSSAIDIRPRIEAAGGNPNNVLVVKAGWIQLPRDIDEIRRAMTEMSDVGMLVIDPLGNHIPGKNSNWETDVRDAINPLNQLADDHQCMVFGVRHLTEKECRNGILAALLGSSAWSQVPRAVLAIVADDQDPTISHIRCVAGNRLPAGTPGRMFRIEGVRLPGLDNDVTRAVWLGDSTKDLDAMLANTNKEPTKSAAARDLILDILETGSKESDELDAQVAREAGLAVGTVRNIRTKLKDEGLIKVHPDKDEDGVILRWNVSRTQATRP